MGIVHSSAALPANPPQAIVSVVIPVRNGAAELRLCLQHLRASAFPDFEVLVVDDASTDDTAAVAAQFGARVLQLPACRGPAAARNAGAKLARGAYLLFIDADVCVHPDTLGRVAEHFNQRPDTDAVFGSYDTHPPAPNFCSQYKNLFHHYVHQRGHEQASTFWSGCGAVRRAVFFEVGGFDSAFARPCIEDIELGVRLRQHGRRIGLDKHIQATHLKRWTFWGVIKSDVLDRGIPWTRLLLQQPSIPNDLNVSVAQRVSLVLAYGVFALVAALAWFFPGLLLAVFLALLAMALLDRSAGPGVAAWGLKAGAALAALAAGVVAVLSCRSWLLLPAPFLAGILVLNRGLYAFFTRERSLLFTVPAFVMHLLYYFYSGVALVAGIGLHLWKGKLDPAVPGCSRGDRAVLARTDSAAAIPIPGHPILDGSMLRAYTP